MAKDNAQLNNDPNQKLPDKVIADTDPAPINDNPASVNDAEVAGNVATPSQPSESLVPPIEPPSPIEADPLEGFDPAVYKDGVEGEERYRILDLYLGYLCKTAFKYDLVKIRCKLEMWDRQNRPPIGVMDIKTYIEANHTRWLRYHHLHRKM